MLKIYNSLTKTKQEFVPLEEGKVKMYACGITVSGPAHIGHGVQAMVFDIIRKYLEKKGYNVNYCRNYTDVDDKIINNAKKLNIDPMVLPFCISGSIPQRRSRPSLPCSVGDVTRTKFA